MVDNIKVVKQLKKAQYEEKLDIYRTKMNLHNRFTLNPYGSPIFLQVAIYADYRG